MAPAGTPREIVLRLNRESQDYLADPAARERMEALHLVLDGGPPDKMAEFIRKESAQWADLIRRTGIRVEG